ncbi:MAG: methionyl-tRNA formyltransferase [Planctomycetota bacterium]
MRSIVLGNKDLAVRSLDALARNGIDVCGVVLTPDDDGVEAGRWYLSLKRAAEARGIPSIQPANVSSDEGCDFIGALRPDLLLSVSYTRIIRPEVLALATVVPLNVHFGDLPHYRGCLPVVHAIANGEAHVGVTLHVMDAGIDTGDVVTQHRVPIGENDTAFTMYFACVEEGERLLDEALPSLVDGSFERHRQDLDGGSYHPQAYPSDRWLNPGIQPGVLSSFVRAHTFPPYPSARVLVAGEEHEIVYRDGTFHVPTLEIHGATAQQACTALERQDWQQTWPTASRATN